MSGVRLESRQLTSFHLLELYRTMVQSPVTSSDLLMSCYLPLYSGMCFLYATVHVQLQNQDQQLFTSQPAFTIVIHLPELINKPV